MKDPGADRSGSLDHGPICMASACCFSVSRSRFLSRMFHPAPFLNTRLPFPAPPSLFPAQREADVRALVELSAALDVKEAILRELREMNSAAEGAERAAAAALGGAATALQLGQCHSDSFRWNYAGLVLRLRDVRRPISSLPGVGWVPDAPVGLRL